MSTSTGQDIRVVQAPDVRGRPRLWLRLDGLVLLTAALVGFATTGQPWWLLPALIFVPDLSMLGYLGGTRLGAVLYNAGHTYLAPTAVAGAAAAGHRPLLLAVALVWLGHIGMDRAAGYGVKYDDGFSHTHLGQLATGRAQGRPSTG